MNGYTNYLTVNTRIKGMKYLVHSLSSPWISFLHRSIVQQTKEYVPLFWRRAVLAGKKLQKGKSVAITSYLPEVCQTESRVLYFVQDLHLQCT